MPRNRKITVKLNPSEWITIKELADDYNMKTATFLRWLPLQLDKKRLKWCQ